MVNKGTPVGFLLLVAFLVLVTIVAVIVIILRAPNTADQLTLIGAIIAFMAPLITSVIALLRAEHANGTAQQTQQQLVQHVDSVDGPKASPANP